MLVLDSLWTRPLARDTDRGQIDDALVGYVVLALCLAGACAHNTYVLVRLVESDQPLETGALGESVARVIGTMSKKCDVYFPSKGNGFHFHFQ
jgi:hypothetical protein